MLRETDPQIMIWELLLPGGQAAAHRAASGRRLPERRALPRPLAGAVLGRLGRPSVPIDTRFGEDRASRLLPSLDAGAEHNGISTQA